MACIFLGLIAFGLLCSYYFQSKKLEDFTYKSTISTEAVNFVNSSCTLKKEFGKYVGITTIISCEQSVIDLFEKSK